MWHVGVTAPPGTNDYSATFEVYVLDTTTGKEVAGTSSGPFVLNWTSADGRPPLKIAPSANGIAMSWPASATNWSLAASENLATGPWLTVTNLPATLNERSSVSVPRSNLQKFYRLQRKL
jgi:hypothetical protein